MSTTHAGFRQHWREVVGTFLKIGALSYGGAASMDIMQTELQEKRAWIPKEQFLDGLALGQLTPGPVLMLAVFVGYAVGFIWGAVVAAAAVYLPSFILMLSVLPLLEHMKHVAWMNAAVQGISPAVTGMTAVAVLRMVPYASPDLIAGAMTVGTVLALVLWRLSPLPLMMGGAAIGPVLRARLS